VHRLGFTVISFSLFQFSHAQLTPEVVGNVRVEALSPNLIRVELKGPEGFEDRPTFHVVERNWAGVPLQRVEQREKVLLKFRDWTVEIPKEAIDLSGVKVVDSAGATLYDGFLKATNSPWLPSPGAKFESWSFRDGPRLIPGPQGLVATNAQGPLASTSGWDLGNDAPDVYVFLPKSNYRQLRREFIRLTGPVEMPPLYMFGFIDSRWYAYSEATALARIDEYRRRKIPLDLLVLDTDWRVGGSHGYTPDPQYLPNLPRFFKEAHAKNVRTMFNDHPEPKAEGALDPAEMKYRTGNLSKVLGEGLDVWWYDRNWFTSLHEPLPGLRKEVWGMRLYHDVTKATRPDERPVIMANVDGIDNGSLDHAPDVAVHKYPVQWTGDTSPTWESLQRAVQNVLTEGPLAANDYVHEDLGGHMGMPTPELYTRYLEYGSLGPIMRVHCTKNLDHAPWVFGPAAERITTGYIKLRYRLLPLLYANAHRAYITGEPMVRRLDLQYPGYQESKRLDQFLVGNDILCAPIIADTSRIDLKDSIFHTPNGQPGLKAEYFANQELEGSPTVVRIDSNLNFNWGEGSPDPKIPVDHFSARWTGKIGPMPGNRPIKLAVTADDGVRVYLDGKLVVDEWKPEDSVTTLAKLSIQPGSTHDLKVEYFEDTGNALCKLRGQGGPSTQGSRSIWIPPGTWTNLWSGARIIGPKTIQTNSPLEQMPLFARDGAIIPIAPPLQYTGQSSWSPLTLEIYPSASKSEFTLFEDDGHSVAYRLGAVRTTEVSSQTKDGKIALDIAPSVGDYQGSHPTRVWRVRIHLPGSKKVRGVWVDRKRIPFKSIAPSSNLMVLTGDGACPGQGVVEIVLPSSSVTKSHHFLLRER
jgi:hypothetical protein